jgi:hypothetical protein
MENRDQEAGRSAGSLADEKSRLELEKLRAEIASLKNSKDWGARIAQYNPVFTVLIAAVGVIVSIQQFNKQQAISTNQYSQQQEFNREQLREQSNRDFAAREQESKKRYWEEQNLIYKEACDAAATIAAADSLEEAKEERKEFRRLYWGIMSLVENRSVEGAMINFGRGLDEWELTRVKPEDMASRAYTIAHCCRKSLQQTWSPVNIGDLKDKDCPY